MVKDQPHTDQQRWSFLEVHAAICNEMKLECLLIVTLSWETTGRIRSTRSDQLDRISNMWSFEPDIRYMINWTQYQIHDQLDLILNTWSIGPDTKYMINWTQSWYMIKTNRYVIKPVARKLKLLRVFSCQLPFLYRMTVFFASSFYVQDESTSRVKRLE